MKIIVTVPSIENESAGPSYTVPALCLSLKKAGAEVELHTLERLPIRDWCYPAVAYKRSRNRLLWYWGWSPSLRRGLERAARNGCDIIHVNGVWQLADIYPNQARKGTCCKIVYCPRGGLSPAALWRGKTVVKKLMWYLGGQYRALKEADMWHAASLKEKDEIRALGFRQPIAVVPNGIEVPPVVHKPFTNIGRKIVYFGRIHATKAVDHLVKAWGRVAREFPEWSLEIAGPDCGAVAELQALINGGDIPRVTFVGEFHGVDKYKFLSTADLYVLPSLTENFGITIAEALACGTPVIASKGCPWDDLGVNNCGWWIDIGPDSLEHQLRDTLAMPPEILQEMGENGRQWMLKEYLWDSVGKKMLAAYEWLVHGGNKPEFVHEFQG